MSSRTIHIDRLEIRVKGVQGGTARAAIDGLGEDLVRHLASGSQGGSGRAARIERIDAGEHRMEQGCSASELRAAIVRRIGDEIERRII